MDIGKDRIKANLEKVKKRIGDASARSGRDPGEITLIAVTKYVGPDQVEMLADLGVTEIGENRVQEARRKIDSVSRDVNWHMIGHLQRNKVKKAVKDFSSIHSVDSERLASEIDKRCELAELKMPVLLEVNVSGEETKFGQDREGAVRLAEAVFAKPNMELKGLMTMAPYSDNPEDSRPYFGKLRELKDYIASELGKPLPWLSMGMTGDFEVAIEEGATHLRIGSALFA